MVNTISGKNKILKYPNTVSFEKYLSRYLGRFTILLMRNKLTKTGKTSCINPGIFLKLKDIFFSNLKAGFNVTKIPVAILNTSETNKPMYSESKTKIMKTKERSDTVVLKNIDIPARSICRD
jgi:hypothetical protein